MNAAIRDHLHSRAMLIALAFAGVLAGHAIAYADGAVHLHAGGAAHVHGYLPSVALVVLPLAVVALFAIAAEELRSGEHIVSVPRLTILQVMMFAIQETLERVASGATVTGIVDERALWAGLVAQVAVAGSLVLAVRWARRAVRPLRQPTSQRVTLLAPTVRAGRQARVRPLRSCRRFEPTSRRGPPVVAAV